MHEHWYLAVCRECPSVQSFRNDTARERWAGAHAVGTGHHVQLREEITNGLPGQAPRQRTRSAAGADRGGGQ